MFSSLKNLRKNFREKLSELTEGQFNKIQGKLYKYLFPNLPEEIIGEYARINREVKNRNVNRSAILKLKNKYKNKIRKINNEVRNIVDEYKTLLDENPNMDLMEKDLMTDEYEDRLFPLIKELLNLREISSVIDKNKVPDYNRLLKEIEENLSNINFYNKVRGIVQYNLEDLNEKIFENSVLKPGKIEKEIYDEDDYILDTPQELIEILDELRNELLTFNFNTLEMYDRKNKDVTVKRNKIARILSNISKYPKFLVLIRITYRVVDLNTSKIKKDTTKQVYFTLSNIFMRKIIDLLEGRLDFSEQIEYSDYSFLSILPEIISVTFLTKEARKGHSNDGNFFPYRLINDKIDLSKLQIFRVGEEVNDENCLINTLRVLEVNELDISIIRNIIQYNRLHIKKSYLMELSKLLERRIILTDIGEDLKHYQSIKGKEYPLDSALRICLFKGHYFPKIKMPYSLFSIKNLDIVTREFPEKFGNVYRRNSQGNLVIAKNDKNAEKFYTTSDKLVKLLWKKGLFKPYIEFKGSHENNIEWHKIPLEKIILDDEKLLNEEQEMEHIEYKVSEKFVFYCDWETLYYRNHLLPLSIGVSYSRGKKYERVEIFSNNNEEDLSNNRALFKCLKFILKKTHHMRKHLECMAEFEERKKPKITHILYFHNLKFDLTQMLGWLNINSLCKKDGIVYNCRFKFGGEYFELRDSYKMVQSRLKDFTNTFNLDISKKECIPYKLYNIYTYKRKFVSYKAAEAYIKSEITDKYKKAKKAEKFRELSKDFTFIENGKKYLKHMEYLHDYLRHDCLVLMRGMLKFKEYIKEITGMNIYEHLTISSLAYRFAHRFGCFKEVYSLTGNARMFCEKSISGGRVMTRLNEKINITPEKENLIAYLDYCSLYPSALYEMCKDFGLPRGRAKYIQNPSKEILDEYDYYIIEVVVNKINIEQQIPMLNYKVKNGRHYTNIPSDEHIVIDKYSLEDLLEFQGAEITYIRGLYWNEGYNKKIGELIMKLYDNRMLAKGYKVIREDDKLSIIKNPESKNVVLANCLKNIMNSIYGKTNLKPILLKTIYMNKTDKLYDKVKKKYYNKYDEFIKKNYNQIESIEDINNFVVMIKLRQSGYNHANKCHIGSGILNYSKRIMNRTLNIFNENNFKVYYTDTDSLFCHEKDMHIVGDIYKNRYGKELFGEYLCQLKNEFGNSFCDRFISVGKKLYCCRIADSGKIKVVLKGVGDKCFNKCFSDPIKTFTDLYNNGKIEIDLSKYKPCFEINGLNTRCVNKNNFIRTITCTSN